MNTATLQAHLASAKGLLEETTRDDDALCPAILVLRGGLLIAQVIPPPIVVDGDTGGVIQRTARLCAEGFGADEIVLVVDTYMIIGDDPYTNPVTGRPYEHGDLEKLVTEHDGIAKGWVTECLSVFVVPRTGTRVMWSLPYHREDDRTVTWGDAQDMSDGAGRMTDLFVSADPVGRPSTDQPDLTMAGILAMMGCTVALAQYEDNRS